MRMSRNIFLMFALVFCASCSGMSGFMRPPATLYALHAARPCAGKTVHQTIAVDMPDVPAGFDSSRIALYLNNGRNLNYYSGAAWPAELPAVLQDFAVQSSRHSCSGLAAAAGDDIHAARLLKIRVNEFAPVYRGDAKSTPELRASLSFTLLSADTKRVLMDFTIENHKMAVDNRLSAVTAGLESLLQDILERAFRRISAPPLRN